jgi:hypothetical protein
MVASATGVRGTERMHAGVVLPPALGELIKRLGGETKKKKRDQGRPGCGYRRRAGGRESAIEPTATGRARPRPCHARVGGSPPRGRG